MKPKIKKVTKVKFKKSEKQRKIQQQKQKYWYKEIPLGIRKVIQVGSSYGITVPKHLINSKQLKKGDEVIVILLKRTRKVADEV